MHNISPTSPVLGDPLQLLPAQPRLCHVCHVARCFLPPHLYPALSVPYQNLSRNVAVWLSQCVAKPSSSSLKHVYLFLNLVRSLPEVLVATFVNPLYYQHVPQAMIRKGVVWLFLQATLLTSLVASATMEAVTLMQQRSCRPPVCWHRDNLAPPRLGHQMNRNRYRPLSQDSSK